MTLCEPTIRQMSLISRGPSSAEKAAEKFEEKLGLGGATDQLVPCSIPLRADLGSGIQAQVAARVQISAQPGTAPPSSRDMGAENHP